MSKQLTCTNCGHEPRLYMRLRSPHGWQPYAVCDWCGARNWEADQDKPWACIRYTDIILPPPFEAGLGCTSETAAWVSPEGAHAQGDEE